MASANLSRVQAITSIGQYQETAEGQDGAGLENIVATALALEEQTSGQAVIVVSLPLQEDVIRLDLTKGQKILINGIILDQLSIVDHEEGLLVSLGNDQWIILPGAPLFWSDAAEPALEDAVLWVAPQIPNTAAGPLEQPVGPDVADDGGDEAQGPLQSDGGGADFANLFINSFTSSNSITGSLSDTSGRDGSSGLTSSRSSLDQQDQSDSGSDNSSDSGGGSDGGDDVVIGDQPVILIELRGRNDSFEVAENEVLEGNLLANDSGHGELRIHAIDTKNIQGFLSVSPDGSVTYHDNGQFEHLGVGEEAVETFTYQVIDGLGRIEKVTATITIEGRNDAPEAKPDAFHMREDRTKTFDATELSRDDFDIDGDELTVISVQDARDGSVVLNEDGTISFTPDENFTGEAFFTYTVSDGKGGTDTAQVRVHVDPVNDAPEAKPDAFHMREDRTKTFDATELSRDDFDIDGDELTVISVQDARDGSVVLNEDGTISFTPDENFTGEAFFTYTVSDGKGGTDTAQVRVHVDPVNDAPEAKPDAFDMLEDRTRTFDATELSRDDFDIDGDELTVISVQDPVDGSVVLNEDGTISFTPDENFTGEAFFTYTVSDGQGAEDTARVRVRVGAVNDAPDAVDDDFSMAEDRSRTFSAEELLGDDSDPDGDELSITSLQDAQNGEAVLNGDGSVTFTPDEGFTGEASFTYTIEDSEGAVDTATVTLTVLEDTDELQEEFTDLELIGQSVLENSSGITIGAVNVSAEGYTLSIDDDRFEFTDFNQLKLKDDVRLNFEREPVIEIGITADNGEESVTETFTIEVIDDNDRPVARDDLVITNRTPGATISIEVESLLSNDRDPDAGDSFELSELIGDQVALNDDGTRVVLTPEAGADGSDVTFDYRISDGEAQSRPGTVTIQYTDSTELNGSDNAEVIIGAGSDDLIDAGGGADYVNGGAGNDVISGGAGADTLEGRAGNDMLSGDSGADTLLGSAGNDTLEGGAGADVLNGGRDDDVLNGGAGTDMLSGGGGNDELNGNGGADILTGNGGMDTLNGGGGADLLTGGAAADHFIIANAIGTDTITDFNGAQGDVLDVSSLLSGHDGDLANYLNISFDGDDTIITIDQSGTGNFADGTQIVLQSVDLAGGETNQTTIINQLVADNQLMIDPS